VFFPNKNELVKLKHKMHMRHVSVDINTHGYIQIVNFHNLLMVSTCQCRIYY